MDVIVGPCFWIMVLEKTLEGPLDRKEIKPVNPKGNQPWIFIGRTDVKTEAPILWPLDTKRRLIGKDPDAGKDWRQEEKWVNEMVGWHHQLNEHEFQQTLGDNKEPGSRACCSPWGHTSYSLSQPITKVSRDAEIGPFLYARGLLCWETGLVPLKALSYSP